MHGFLKTVKLCLDLIIINPKGLIYILEKKEIGYIYRGLEALKQDIVAMIKKENFIYEDE